MQNKSYHVSRSQSDFSRITTEHHLNDDLKFLIACCQTEPSDDDKKFILSHLSRITNYQSLITAATQHGILPLVYKTIKQITEDNSPRSSSNYVSPITNAPSGNALGVHEILSAFKQQYLIIAQRNMLMSAELIRIMKLLKENKVEALAFKGPALSQMAYGDITLRQYTDLDVLVKKEDIYKIDALLKERGYERVLKITPTQEEVYMKNAHDLGLYHPKSGVHFEMHWSLMSEDYPMQIDLAAIWEDPQTVKINGKEISTFPTEELLLYLCIHGSKHLWERIEWIKDIDLMIQTQKIDWEVMIERSKDTGFEKMVYLGLSLAAQLFNTPLPQNITQHMTKLKVLDELSDFVLQSWRTSPSTFQKTAAMLKLFPGTKEKLIYLNTILIKPSLNEYWAVDLPKGLYWLYYFVRPYMLMKKYFT